MSSDMFPDTYIEYVIADSEKRKKATLEWVAEQDEEILNEILNHGEMVVILCSCDAGGCKGFRLAHPVVMNDGDLIVYDKNGVVEHGEV